MSPALRFAPDHIFRIIILFVQFPVETVREVAQLLNDANLGEISLENTATGAKLSLKRAVYYAAPPTQAEIEEAVEEAAAVAAAEQVQADISALITIASPAVGVFRPAKIPLKIGDEVGKKALLGAVETLNIPSELYATQSARVVEILVAEGQGVEWGQPLIVLEPVEK
ncbi:biotin/lipoyl-binding protein [bacterium]|nr:MAG: biotin/lipoyl-binding protein [bacterium]